MATDFTVYKIRKGIDVDTAMWSQDPAIQAEQVFEVRHGSDFKELVDKMFRDKKNRLSDGTDNIQCFLRDFETPEAKEIFKINIEKYHLLIQEQYQDFIKLLKDIEHSDYYLVCSVI